MSDLFRFILDSIKLVAPILIVDMWFKQVEVNYRLDEIQESVNELNEDEDDDESQLSDEDE